MSHEELRELLAFAALGELDGADAAELDDHLVSCPSCSADLAAFQEIVGWAGAAVDPIAPPTDLRARVLESVRAAPRTSCGFSRSVGALGVLVAAAAVVAATMYALGLAARVRAMEGQLTEQRETATFLASPDTTTIVLAGTEQAPEARLKLIYDRQTGRALLFGYDVPSAPQGMGYQLWFITGGEPLPGPVFEPGAGGGGQWTEEVPPEGRNASVFAVTLEPAGGVAAPTGPMILKSVSVS